MVLLGLYHKTTELDSRLTAHGFIIKYSLVYSHDVAKFQQVKFTPDELQNVSLI